MPDKISKERRSRNMRRIRSGRTNPEMAVRRTVYWMGRRYRVSDSSLPGRPDLVFEARRQAVFVHGCFWHQHPIEGCVDSRLPGSRTDYWIPKLKSNVDRDRRSIVALAAMGWESLVIWECEVERHPEVVTKRLAEFLA